MICRDVVTFLIDYVEGNLTADEQQNFDRHLALCSSCRAYLRTYRTTIRMEKHAYTAAPPDPPDELVEAILAARSRG